MRKEIVLIAPAAILAVAALVSGTPARYLGVIPRADAAAQPDAAVVPLCRLGNATLRGRYMSKGGGTIPGLGPVAFIGQLIYDGKGHVTNPYTLSLSGAIYSLTDAGPYTVNSDCTGTHTSGDGSQHYSFIVSPDGRKLDYIETDPGTIISGSAVRVDD